MDRRQFSARFAAVALAAASLAGAAAPALAQAVEGRDYQRVERPVAVAPGKVDVTEMFGYWCPHCAAFEPEFAAWASRQQASGKVAVRRIPLAFRPAEEALARLYYALEGLGLVEQVHAKVFTAIHQQRKSMRSESEILAWLPEAGLDAATVQKVGDMMKSFAVATKVRQGNQLAAQLGNEAVPTIYVQGRWRTSHSLAGAKVLGVVDQLIAQAAAGK